MKAVVTSCGWTPFGDYYGGNITGWTSDRYMPRLKDAYGLGLLCGLRRAPALGP